MADGHARATGDVSVLVVTPGPGLGNIVGGCMEAFSDDVPLLILHIDTGRKDIGKGILHELKEPEEIFRHIAKKTLSASRPHDLVPMLDRGYRLAAAERKGPVVVSIPYAWLEKDVPFHLDEWHGKKERPDMSGVGDVMRGKSRPVIIGGKSLMREDLRAVLDGLCGEKRIPFLTTTAGKGVISEGNAWAFGNIMQKGTARRILASADVVIALGTRLRDVDAKRRGVKIGDLIHIDTDDAWIGRNYPVKHGSSGDMEAAVRDLDTFLGGRRFDWDFEGLKRDQKEEMKAIEAASPGFRLVKLVKEAVPDETTTVWDLSLPGYWAEYYYPVTHQRTFIMPKGVSPIFYAFPAGIGAKLGRPERPCLSICGDGSFLPSAAELATVRQYDIPLVILVYNNMSYGVLEDYMDSSYGIKGSMALINPDFVKLAQSFGIKAKRATTLSRLRDIFRRHITWDEPYLIEFFFPIVTPPWK